MPWVRRLLAAELRHAALHFPVVVLTGPRRSGKTALLRRCFPRASWRLLEDPDVLARVQADPRGFLDEAGEPVILDEIQNAPELFRYVRSRADSIRGRRCRWFLTGSQEAGLMRGVTESMAGRAAVLHLLPFSLAEHPSVSPFRGGFPEALARPAAANLWYRSYIQTYLEQDVRRVTAIRNLATFRRFLALLAARAGQELNRTEIAGPLGVSIPTVSDWIGILETTMQVMLVPPFHENLGKRLVKSPKLHFMDPGLLCHLLGLDSAAALARSPYPGAVFEGFVASEIAKAQVNAGRRREIYFFRDRQGLEVDFLVPLGGARLALLEAKASRTVGPGDAGKLAVLGRAAARYETSSYVVYAPSPSDPGLSVLAPGVRALPVNRLAGVVTGTGE